MPVDGVIASGSRSTNGFYRGLFRSAAFAAALAIPVGAIAQTTADPTPPAPPAHPFSARVVLSDNTAGSAGGGGELVITNIVLTNFDSAAQQVFIFAPLFVSGGKCGDPVTGGTTPQMQIYVQPRQTMVIPYPTGLVMHGHKPNCIAAQVESTLNGGAVEMDVTGYTQPTTP